MTKHKLQPGDRVRIADVPSTRSSSFVPGLPGNTGTVSSIRHDGALLVDLDPKPADSRLPKSRLRAWPYDPQELEAA